MTSSTCNLKLKPASYPKHDNKLPPYNPIGLYIQTYGCQMNVNDSERMLRLLKIHGFTSVSTPEEAALIIVNTCEVREKASEKLYSYLGNIAVLKEQRAAAEQRVMVIVAGCSAQGAGEEIKKRARCVDAIVGTGAYHLLPEILEKLKRSNKLIVELDFEENKKFDALNFDENEENAQVYRNSVNPSAFLSIQEGCDKFCTFCVVPYTRGAEYSRPVEAIYREALRLVANGAVELMLLGQNVSAYHGKTFEGKEVNLADLMELIAQIPGVRRLGYTTSHPMDMTSNNLFSMHKDISKLNPYLHLPIQSGSDSILQAMNRRYTIEQYKQIIAKYRAYRSDIALSSDFIVGFPGETEADFAATLDLVRDINYGAQCYVFAYSERPGTTAAAYKDKLQINEAVKNARVNMLLEELRKQQLRFNEASVGKSIEVLLLKEGKKPGQLIGKSGYNQSVVIQGEIGDIGSLVQVYVEDAQLNSVMGRVVGRVEG